MTTVDIARLSEITREAYEGRLPGTPRLVMAASTAADLRGMITPPDEAERLVLPRDLFGRLTAIPIFLDDAIPAGAWRLVDAAGREIERGGFPAAHDVIAERDDLRERADFYQRERDDALAERDRLWDATGIDHRDGIDVEFVAGGIRGMVDRAKHHRTEIARLNRQILDLLDERDKLSALVHEGAGLLREGKQWQDRFRRERDQALAQVRQYERSEASIREALETRGINTADMSMGVGFLIGREIDRLRAEQDQARCRVCGCTDEQACEGGCTWVADPRAMGDLCSACLPDAEAPAQLELLRSEVERALGDRRLPLTVAAGLRAALASTDPGGPAADRRPADQPVESTTPGSEGPAGTGGPDDVPAQEPMCEHGMPWKGMRNEHAAIYHKEDHP